MMQYVPIVAITSSKCFKVLALTSHVLCNNVFQQTLPKSQNEIPNVNNGDTIDEIATMNIKVSQFNRLALRIEELEKENVQLQKALNEIKNENMPKYIDYQTPNIQTPNQYKYPI